MTSQEDKKQAKERMIESLKGDGVWSQIPIAKTLQMDTNRAESVDWSDEYFRLNFVEKAKLTSRPTPAEAAVYAKSFLNWYVYNQAPSTIQDSIIGLISSVKYAEKEYLISDDFFDTESTNTLGAPGLISQITNGTWQSGCQGAVTPQNLLGASSTGLRRAGTASVKSISTSDAGTWYQTLWSFLSATLGDDSTYPLQFHYAIYYLGFIAMQMLRVCVKDENMVALHIMTYTTERYTKFFGINLNLKDTIPPHDSMLSDFKINFDRFKLASIRCLTMIVHSHITISGDKKDLVQSMFRAVGLLSLPSVGLGCVGWLFRAHETTNVGVDTLLNYMAVERHAAMVRSILLFTHTTGGNLNEKSWQWCRLFTDGAFAELSTQRDVTFAAIFMEFATGAPLGDDLWNIPQFHGKMTGQTKKFAYNWGQEIIRDILLSTTENAKTAETKRIAARMEKLLLEKDRIDVAAKDGDLHELEDSGSED